MKEQNLLKKDLRMLEPKVFYMKHIVKSHNWYFSEYLHFPPNIIVDKMDDFKEIVSSRLGINFHNVQIVGSAKVGYSLSPGKLFMPFHDGTEDRPSSDIDIAIISDTMYRKYWDELRQAKKIYYQKLFFSHLTKSIFNGYINEKDIRRVENLNKDWEQMIRNVNVALQDSIGFVHPISYRLYRSWEDLEIYQIRSIARAQKNMEEFVDV